MHFPAHHKQKLGNDNKFRALNTQKLLRELPSEFYKVSEPSCDWSALTPSEIPTGYSSENWLIPL